MGRRGPAPKLAIVEEREGNPGHRPIHHGVRLEPIAPDEPDWAEIFPEVPLGRKPKPPPAGPGRLRANATDLEKEAHAQVRLAHAFVVSAYHQDLRDYEARKQIRSEARRCREVAAARWAEMIRPLDAQGILARIDEHELRDAAVLMARLDQAERDISRRGLNVEGSRGIAKNPSVTAANGFREKLRAHVQDFGLSPLARDRLNPREGGDGQDSDFD